MEGQDKVAPVVRQQVAEVRKVLEDFEALVSEESNATSMEVIKGADNLASATVDMQTNLLLMLGVDPVMYAMNMLVEIDPTQDISEN